MPKPFVLMDVPLQAVVIANQKLRHDPNDDSIIELADSINQQTLLQPVGMKALDNNTYELIWGGRRFAAHVRLGRPTIEAKVYKTLSASVKTLAIIENIQREQMTLSEECDAVAHLTEVEELSPDQIATRLSKSRQWVLRRLCIPNLPPDIVEATLDGQLPISHAEEIATIEDPGQRAYITSTAISAKANLSEVRAMVQAAKQVAPNHAEAVEAGVQAALLAASQPIMVKCAFCQTPRQLPELLLVRICVKGCPEPSPTAAEEKAVSA